MYNRIGQLRREHKMSLKELGAKINVKDNTLSQYETGKRNPPINVLKDIAHYFNVSLEYLTMNTYNNDFPIDSTEKAIYVLEKFHNKKLNYDNLSIETAFSLEEWIYKNQDIFKKEEYKHLLITAYEFSKYWSTQRDLMLESKNKELEKYDTLLKIHEKLENISNSQKHLIYILEIIEESENMGLDELHNVLNSMKTFNKNKK